MCCDTLSLRAACALFVLILQIGGRLVGLVDFQMVISNAMVDSQELFASHVLSGKWFNGCD